MSDVLSELADRFAADTDSDLILISGPIDFSMQDMVTVATKERGTRSPKLTFLLCTPGGSADVAYRIARAFQDSYSEVTAFVAGWCKSAGTLCVIGANQLVMTDEAELGPLDVQISKRDEIGERDSGLVVSEALNSLEKHAFSLFENIMIQIKERSDGTVSFKMAADLSAVLTGELLEPIYRQIDPEKLGATARSLAVANEYGKRLNVKGKNITPNALHLLGVGYPSHGFVIDRREAQRLFKLVREPTELELQIVAAVGKQAYEPSDTPVVKYLNSLEKKSDTKSAVRSNTRRTASKKASGTK